MPRPFTAVLFVGFGLLFQACGSGGGAQTASGGAPSGGNGPLGGAGGGSGGSVVKGGGGSAGSSGGNVVKGGGGGADSSAGADAGTGADVNGGAAGAPVTTGGEGGAAGDPGTVTGDAGAGGCPDGTIGAACTPVKRIFVTKGIYTGNLVSYVPGAASGLAAADALCNSSAQSAGLSGTFRAWLSTASVNAIDRLTDVGPWYVLNTYYAPRYANKAAIIVSSPGQIIGIATTEDGSSVSINGPGGVIVWTGTAANGSNTNAAAPITFCADWTSGLANATGTYGFANRGVADPSWTQYTGLNTKCDGPAHLYCFEQ